MIIKQLNSTPGMMHVKDTNTWKDDECLFNKDDLSLSKSVDDLMRAHIDIEHVLNDPQLGEAETQAAMMVSGIEREIKTRRGIRKFITEAIPELQLTGNTTGEEIEVIDESEAGDISDITSGWVQEWQNSVHNQESQKEIRDFISGSIGKTKRNTSSRLIITILTLSAAAVAAILLVMRNLTPVDPEQLFKSNYEPMSVISTTVRDALTIPGDNYSIAIDKYRAGEYAEAASLFSSEMNRDTSRIAPRFFMGLSEEAMGNYSQAVILLSDISRRSGEYKKIAQWYLGLTYLKLADKKQAASCFRSLASSPGFYREKSENILRRLK